MTHLLTPSLSLLLFFAERRLAGVQPELPLVKHLGLSAEMEEGERHYRGMLEHDLTCDVRTTLAHDTLVVRCDLTLSGDHPAEAWERLSQRGMALLEMLDKAGHGSLWAVTLIYYAVLPAGLEPAALPDLLVGLPLPASMPNPSFEKTPYGWLLMLEDGADKKAPPLAYRRRSLLLLVPQERAGKVMQYFLSPLRQGVARIERHLQKALHHADLQQESSAALGQAILQLREGMSGAISTMDFSDLYHEARELERVSTLLMSFLNQKAHAELVLHSLRINVQDFSTALEEVKLVTPLYEREKQYLARRIEQLESDLEYARVVSESTYAFQEMQRGIENNRLQRASLMLGTAAALLAGITIFNSFLDIWTLILEGSDWVLPPMGLRMGIGLLAGVAWPLATYWLIVKRRAMIVLWIGLGVLSFALAILSTVWVNL